MADFTQSILKDYAQKKARESKQGIMDELLSYGSTTSPTPYNLAANNYQGMITKGIGGLVDFAQSGERRAADEAQQKLAAEETAYQRGRDTLRDSISLEENQRAKEQFEFDKSRQLKADQKEAEQEQIAKNNILFNRNMLTELGEYNVKKEGVDSTVRLGLDRGYLQGDQNGDLKLVAPQNVTPEEQKIYDEFASTFNSLSNLSEERKLLEKKWKTQAENTLLDNDKSNDITSTDTAEVWSTFDKSNQEKLASAQALIEGYNKEYDEKVRQTTGTITGDAKEFLTDYMDIKGNLEISPDNYDNWNKSEDLTKENVQEADRLRNKLKKDKRLAHLTDKQKDWVIGSSLKLSKGLGQDDALFGEAFDYATTRGIWADDKVNTVIDEQLNKLNQVISASDTIRQDGLVLDQLVNNVNAEIGFIQGRSNLLRALK